ncbi:MAG: L,D-transpeptidase family protein [Clostridiales bacterium]|nr:L,D-transpeptidase family protein [Bacillota bacterium]NLL54289.1 L,D-transpeptidase family protein [Clostridiales bacterium]
MRKLSTKLLVLLCAAFIICLGTASMSLAEAVSIEVPQSLALVRESRGNTLSWDAVEGATGYRIYRAAAPGARYRPLASTTRLTYTHRRAPANQFYKVRAVVGRRGGALTPCVGSVAPATRFTRTYDLDTGRLSLSWRPVRYADSYTVEFSGSKAGPWETLQSGLTECVYERDLVGTEPGFFRIRSVYGGTPTGASAVLGVFEPITGLRVVCEERYATGPTDRLNVAWNGSYGATGYRVYRAALPDNEFTLLGTTANTYYPDVRYPHYPENLLKTYAYKVQPVYGGTVGKMSAPATLWSGMPGNIPAPAGVGSPSGILLVVNKDAQVVTAYGKDREGREGRFTVVLRHMICSTGKIDVKTPEGTRPMLGQEDEWYRYPSGVYIRYPSIYRNGLFFHSVLYSSGRRVMGSTVARLGTRQSLGCVRLKVSDAKWVYDHCALNNTTVYITQGRRIPALTKALRPRNVRVRG